MSTIYFFYGLAFFSLGIVASIEARRASKIALAHHLPWLAIFSISHAIAEWTDLGLLFNPNQATEEAFHIIHTVLIPLSSLFLLRFGAGLILDAGPVPEWLNMLPVAIIIPMSLLLAYAITLATTSSDWVIAADVWSRHILYFPGCLLSGWGLLRQRQALQKQGLKTGGASLIGAGVAFFINALVAGAIVPESDHFVTGWINYESALLSTGIPIQIWRTFTAIAIAIFVLRALSVFEAERQEQIKFIQREREHELSIARDRAEEWTNGIVSLSRKIASLEPIENVLNTLVATLPKLLNCDSAAFGLWNDDRSGLLIKSAFPPSMNFPDGTTFCDRLICNTAKEGKPSTISHEEGWDYSLLDDPVHYLACVPLSLEDEELGVLWAIRKLGNAFTKEELKGLQILADQAMIALEHTMMAARLQSIATFEERSRIAREMHDSLAQLLGYLNLELQTLEKYIQREDFKRARDEVLLARQRVKEAQEDVSENIISLRTTLAPDGGFVPALKAYTKEFSLHTGLEVELLGEESETFPLSPIAEAQLVRIIQEALTNVRKHANAEKVRIKLSPGNGFVNICIIDDGIGFKLLPRRGHFGLQTMRERAEVVGGGLTVSSDPGKGTQVEVWIPITAAS
jgi:signal transduction histidine kinase